MKWKRNTGYDQIEDRRGQGGGLGGVLGGSSGGGGIPIPIPGGKAGGGIGGVIVAIVLFLIFSGVLGGGGLGSLGGLSGGAAQPGGTLNPEGDTDAQLAYIVNSVQVFWTDYFAKSGKEYPKTTLVLFDTATSSPCGQASAATGPFYCPADQKVYLDLSFMDELQTRFGAKGGDFAMAYVVAHEFGHHVQDALGIMQQVQSAGGDQNDLSVRLELQADCLAGAWAHAAASDLEPDDIGEALSAATAVGDDRIQQATTGQVNPETWTHGSAAQRSQWFTTGYQSGVVGDCDTFNA